MRWRSWLRVNKKESEMDFQQLAKIIEETQNTLIAQATKSVNVCLTLTNWLIGYRIQEYELNG
jgi:hypothetical protein